MTAPWPAPPVHRIDVNAPEAFAAGRLVYTRYLPEHDPVLGMVLRCGHDAETGEAFVTVLTDSATRPKLQPSLSLIRRDGSSPSHVPLGPLARIERLSVADVDPGMHSDLVVLATVRTYARKALLASAVAPCERLGSSRHIDMVRAYDTLRSLALEMEGTP